jgi:hypothetical protein
MIKLLMFSFVFVVFATSADSVFAGPQEFGNSLRETARAGGITPHGVWETK